MDMGSYLNVIPKTTFLKLSLEGVNMKPSSLAVKAFDSSRRAVIGEVYLAIRIGLIISAITLQVMDIHLTYSYLLGRPWIHSKREITSILHQKL